MNLAELYEASRTRAAKQHVIEDHICRFNPDFMEAAELVAAVLGGLRGRYEELGMDVEGAFRDLMDALHEADMTKQTGDYDEMTVAKWEQEKQREEEERLIRSEHERQG